MTVYCGIYNMGKYTLENSERTGKSLNGIYAV